MFFRRTERRVECVGAFLGGYHYDRKRQGRSGIHTYEKRPLRLRTEGYMAGILFFIFMLQQLGCIWLRA